LLKIVCEGREKEAVFYDEEVITIGRSPKNTLQIDDTKASRRHCLIEKGDGVYRVVDLGSRNGTKVNGRTVDAQELTKGDRIVTGNATIIVKEIAFPGKTTVPSGSARPKPAAPARPAPRAAAPSPAVEKKAAAGSARVSVPRRPREMPMGLLDYLLVLVILLLILYIVGVLFFVVKERIAPSGPAPGEGAPAAGESER